MAATFNIPDGRVDLLIGAINTANINDDFDTINLATNGLYTLTVVNNTTNGANGLPLVQNDVSFGGTEIGTDLTINGNGARLERSEFAPNFRILQVFDGATCVINNLNMNRGRVLDVTGSQGGGAIFNNASRFILSGCTFDNNSTMGMNGAAGNPAASGGAGRGGAISNASAVVMIASNCTFTNNKADGGNGGNSTSSQQPGGHGADGEGGAIYCSNEILNLSNCTFIGNFGSGGLGGTGGPAGSDGDMKGGAIFAAGGFLGPCTFTSNSAIFGGALFTTGNVTLDSCTMTFNIASKQGGAFYNGGTALINNCSINNGRATSLGGGVLNYGALTITNSSFSGNVTDEPASGGGAVCHFPFFNEASFLTIRNTIFQNNHASSGTVLGGLGGALYNFIDTNTPSHVIVDRCTFRGNTGKWGGGGICHSSNIGPSSLTVRDSTFTGNSSQNRGGGIYHRSNTSANVSLTVTNSTFSGNSTSGTSFGRGGGICVLSTGGSANATILSSTFSGNSALEGGACATERTEGTAALNLSNTILNTGGAAGENLANFGGIITSQGNNLSNDGGGGYLNATGDLPNTNPQLNGIAFNGGPTETHSLLSNSPAINAGNGNAPSRDQRAYSRQGASDIGAFEFGGQPAAPATAAVVSRKMHGATPFDIDLPVSGSPGIECRSGGANNDYQIIATFVRPVGYGDVTVTSGTGFVLSTAANGETVTIFLRGVTSGQTTTVTMAGVSDGINMGNVSLPMGILVGDTNGNRTVNATDIGQTKAQSGQPVGAGNFRSDLNANGSINATDIGQVKAQSGTTLP